jgi:hypothetical protein
MDLATDTIVIPTWANGPDASANGGWAAGLLAQHVEAPVVSVSLRVPPPLGRPLEVVRIGEGAELRDEDLLVADAAPAALSARVPRAVTGIELDAARTAMRGFPFRDRHPFPHCISCGIERGDAAPALHIHAGPLQDVVVADDSGADVRVYASAWTPGSDLAAGDDAELTSVEACWSALDCPSAAPCANPDAEHPSVLARITVELRERARVGEPYVLAAWQLSVDGRKQRSASALLDARGRVLGLAEALWNEVRPRRASSRKTVGERHLAAPTRASTGRPRPTCASNARCACCARPRCAA